MIRLSAFADEISGDLNEQIAVLQAEHIQYINLRSVWGVNVLALDEQQIMEIKRTLDAHGMRVATIASPIGKVPVDTPFTEHLQRFIQAIAVAQRFQTRYIRLFSFYPPAFPEADSHDPSCYRDEVLRRLRMSARAPPEEEGEREFLALAIFRSRRQTDISLRRQRANARSRWQHFGR